MRTAASLPRRGHAAGRFELLVVTKTPFYSDRDHRLVEHAAPAWIKTIWSPNSGFGPRRLNVPRIEVFACDALRKSAHSP
jgi:hypothetical protein